MTPIRTTLAASILATLALSLAGPTQIRATEKPKAKVMQYEEAERLVKAHLDIFDDLDYNVFTNQKWTELHRSHSQDVLVHWPDGHTTKGIEKHIQDLSDMFVYAPDTQIKQHPIHFGSKEWTCVTGLMTGTFTKPMPLGGGKFIPPTGKKFNLPMCTVGHWVDGVMTEEWLYWDNATYMKQIGLGK